MRLVSLLVLLLFPLAACAPVNMPASSGTLTPVGPATSAAGPGATGGKPFPSLTPTLTPFIRASEVPQANSLTPSPTPEIYRAVAVSLRVRGSSLAMPEVDAGTSATIELAFEPVILTVRRLADGRVSSTSSMRWENAQIGQMRTCLAAGTGCNPPQDWAPFEPSVSSSVKVDWLGPRPFYAWAEFRDPLGKMILSRGSDTIIPGAQTTIGLSILGKANPATPLAKLPPPVQTALAATRAAFPVSGSVVIMDGACCAGGKAGSKISLKVSFQASSPLGSVTEMKVQTGGECVKDPGQLKGGWEPFLPTRSYEVGGIPLNWTSWWVSVQYRDGYGNLSPVYCDDIGIEGSP
jgi:hypothetical protein